MCLVTLCSVSFCLLFRAYGVHKIEFNRTECVRLELEAKQLKDLLVVLITSVKVTLFSIALSV